MMLFDVLSRTTSLTSPIFLPEGYRFTFGEMDPKEKHAMSHRAEELSLEAGLEFERRSFYLLFDTEDQKEGMAAFAEKRKPSWRGR